MEDKLFPIIILAVVGILVLGWPLIEQAITPAEVVRYYERPENLTDCADAAWAELLRGNERFIQGEKVARDWSGLREHHEAGQWPFVSIVSCSDSRFSPEVVFDQGIGDVFIVRTAGNTVAELALGSLEFSVNVLGTPLIVVLGHEGCGAVHATVDHQKGVLQLPFTPDKLVSVVVEIVPAADKAIATGKTDIELREYATRLNAIFVAQEILTYAAGIKEAVARGEVVVIGAKNMFDGTIAKLFRVDSGNLSPFMRTPGIAGGCCS
ncbi:carbonic anhydrase [Candidatus Bipolaricaulota bacterium]|nr:carbonic anhydrase [Candidatus Bipolaricaulota bacterium]